MITSQLEAGGSPPHPTDLKESVRQSGRPTTRVRSGRAIGDERTVAEEWDQTMSPNRGPEVKTSRPSWLLLAVSEDRQHGGNDGYDDEPSAAYSWDNTVPNYARVQEGDAVVLWDKRNLLGASLIDDIEIWETTKLLHRCRYCSGSKIKPRKTKSPRFKCHECGRAFDEPSTSEVPVTAYRSHYAQRWTDLGGRLTPSQLRSCCLQPKSQLSMRQLDWSRFEALLGDEDLFRPDLLSVPPILGGFAQRIVRARIGQASFRAALLSRYGEQCAFTGPAPADALEACHLYSYAQHGEHHDEGGILLRRDLHRLFDLGHIAVNPRTNAIDVSQGLQAFAVYHTLHGIGIRISPTSRQRQWLDDHWRIHRSS